MSKANAATKAEATPQETETKVIPLEPISALLVNDMFVRESGVRFNTWEAIPPAGTKVEHLKRPDFWANVARKLKPGSVVIVWPADGQYYAEMLVWDAGQNWARLDFKPGFPMQRPSFDAVAGEVDKFDVRYHPSKGWQVVERDTNRVLKEHMPNAEEARRWKMEYMRVLRT